MSYIAVLLWQAPADHPWRKMPANAMTPHMAGAQLLVTRQATLCTSFRPPCQHGCKTAAARSSCC